MWDIDTARSTYSIPYWGEGYFDINPQGNLIARPAGGDAGIDLSAVTTQALAEGLSLPLLVRFSDILRDRVDRLIDTFDQAISNHDYQGGYRLVYPIKVNQQRCVVEPLVQHGAGRVGLEAGSKPELMAVLALAEPPGGVVVCNGYKDREYIRLALTGRRLGLQVYIVIEKLSELRLVIEEAARLGVEPLLGIRVRLASIGGGKWQNSGGEKAKFGLTANQVLDAVAQLRSAGLGHCLQMVHFHMGSQIANIRDIETGIREAGRFYSELYRMGVPLVLVDVGGGLGIDYEGSRSRSFCSMNYGLYGYASAIVQTLREVCDEGGVPHPDIISESGRALTAHHAVLVTNVIDEDATLRPEPPTTPPESPHPPLQRLWEALQAIDAGGVISELYHEALYQLSELQEMYLSGALTLVERAEAERLYFAICHRLKARLRPENRHHRELLDQLDTTLADKYFCNFSLFQSMPDIWGIEQIFPVVPLQRLDEEPVQRVVLEDITCDSDGRIDRFVENEGVHDSLPVHPLRPGERYLLGMFLVGAYQEILGDMHNLFGDTDAVNVELDPSCDAGFRLLGAQHGDTVESVLRYVNYEPEALRRVYRQRVAALDGSEAERATLLETLLQGIEGYTYLEE